MIKYRWVIPAAFGGICLVLGVLSLAFSKDGMVLTEEATLRSGNSATYPNLQLEADKRYTLFIRPTNGVPVNTEEAVAAALLRDGQAVFEIEDYYWHQRGTWREGGESGTWEEQNSSTQFNFVVPETGNYTLEVTLARAGSIAGDQLQVALQWRAPWLLSGWPLFIGALLLFGLAGWSATTVRGALGKYLEDVVGPGSKLKIGEVTYDVVARHEHFEGYERCGVEFQLRATIGTTRWLAIDRYWREHPWIEDGDQTLVQILMDAQLTQVEKRDIEQLQASNQAQSIVVIGPDAYTLDRDNSGTAMMVTMRDGESYQSRYHCNVYRNERRIPLHAGERWVEEIRWQGDDRVEWAVMELIDFNEIEIVEVVEPAELTAEDAQPQRNADPFGVRSQQNADPFGVRPGDNSYASTVLSQKGSAPGNRAPGGSQQDQDQEQEQEQKHPQYEPHDWNS